MRRRNLRLLRVSGIVVRLRMFRLLITFLSAAHSFFFSSRRRHTRFDCDWSSDVCSSDLNAIVQSQDALNSQTIQRPNTIAQQQAQVSSAQAQVLLAQTNLNSTTLTAPTDGDRKSTRLNSSHSQISYAVFCLKKKKITLQH